MVDDNDDVRAMLVRLLRNTGADVVAQANSGAAALLEAGASASFDKTDGPSLMAAIAGWKEGSRNE